MAKSYRLSPILLNCTHKLFLIESFVLMHCILLNCFLQLKLTLLYIKDHERVMCKKYYSLYPITMATDSIGGGGGGGK